MGVAFVPSARCRVEGLRFRVQCAWPSGSLGGVPGLDVGMLGHSGHATLWLCKLLAWISQMPSLSCLSGILSSHASMDEAANAPKRQPSPIHHPLIDDLERSNMLLIPIVI